MLPVGDGFASVKIGDMVQVSLRTAEGRDAKQLHVVADAALKRFWEAQRTGPVRLTHKQVVALAGRAYQALVGAREDDPGPVETWARAEETLLQAEFGSYGRASLKIGTDAERRAWSLEERLGATANEWLAREGLVVDTETRTRFIEQLLSAIRDGNLALMQRAQGDYSPDPAADRFPEWVPPADAPKASPNGGALTAAELFERWREYHADKKARNTLKWYSASLRSLAEFTGVRDVRSLTDDDLHRWAEHRPTWTGSARGP